MLTLTARNRAFPGADALPPIVPVLVGATSAAAETRFGRVLAPYLAQAGTVVVVSSDFCHWGSRFRYTYYEEGPADRGAGRSLRAGDRIPPGGRPIHESIADVDGRSMDAVESGSAAAFRAEVDRTGNTVCGRHPIGLVMAALEEAVLEEVLEEVVGRDGGGRFRFVRYEQSSQCSSVKDSSVSYSSAYAVM